MEVNVNPDVTGEGNSGTGEGAAADGKQPDTGKVTDHDYAQARKKIEKQAAENAKLQAKIDELAAKSKTDAEKAIDEAYRKGVTETETSWQARTLTTKIRHTIETKLVGSGVPKNQVSVVLDENPELETPEDAETAAGVYAERWTKEILKGTPPRTPGGSPEGTPAKPDDWLKKIGSASDKEIRENAAAINEQIKRQLTRGV